MTAKSSDTTDVIFKVFSEGDVIAMFPGLAGSSKLWQCLSYQHSGQHGPADIQLTRTLKTARPAEYASLKRELERQGYTLKIVKRATIRHERMRKKEIQ